MNGLLSLFLPEHPVTKRLMETEAVFGTLIRQCRFGPRLPCLQQLSSFDRGEDDPSANTKRMMETKAVFGTLIRRCRKHLDDMAKHFNPKEFSKAVALACLSYNVCRDSIIEKTTRQLFLCLYNAASNKVGPFYTYLNVTEDFRRAVFDGMMCAGLTDILDSPITAIDDLATYSRWVALSFG
ncbi:hypothetical protein MRX96_016451 [Rhipicephalus microplus]